MLFAFSEDEESPQRGYAITNSQCMWTDSARQTWSGYLAAVLIDLKNNSC